MERFRPQPWDPNLPFDWATDGRQLSEEERQIARRLDEQNEKPEKLSTEGARKALTKQ